MLKIEEEEWVDDIDQLKAIGRSFFNKLYSKEAEYDRFLVSGMFPKLIADEMEILSKEVSDEKIKIPLFARGSWYAPGLDGLPAMFFQHSWDSVRNSLCSWVKEVLEDPAETHLTNATRIAVIRKVTNMEFFSQFRPISLYNVSYKIVTTIVASRLQKVMEKLVSKNQCSFIPDVLALIIS